MDNIVKSVHKTPSSGSISKLLTNQSIYIDAHGRENHPNERDKIFDDPNYNLHLHKVTYKVAINGYKDHQLEIKIPLNDSSRKVEIKARGEKCNGKQADIPTHLAKEIRDVFKDTKKRDSFAKDIVDTLKGYPSKNIKDDEKRAEYVLKNVAKAFDIEDIPIKKEWFTHINKDQNGVSMLSQITDRNERYNFLACNDFMFAEKALPTKKFIFAVTGAAHRGKTEIVKMVYQKLLDAYPEHAIIIEDGRERKDIKAILFIHGAKVGIESQGDPYYRQPRSIDEFVSMGCDVILTAGRTSGETMESYDKYQDIYIIEKFYRSKIEDEGDRYLANRDFAQILTNKVMASTIAAFEGL